MSSDDDGSSLGSDFAVMDAEYSNDSDGELKETKTSKQQKFSKVAQDAASTDTQANLEERRRQKRLAKLDKKIKQATKR